MRVRLWVVAAILIIVGLVAGLPAHSARAQDAQNTPQPPDATTPEISSAEVMAAPDLTVLVETDPADPDAGDTVDIVITVKNIGDAAANSQVKVELYEGASSEPGSGDSGFPIITIPSLAVGAEQVGVSASVTMPNTGCDYAIYAWVDRGNTIAESNESNNLVLLRPLCDAPSCSPDAFEADNSCSAAKWFDASVAQDRNYCEGVVSPDQDWVKFTAYSGITYTVATSTTTSSADPRITVYDACGGTAVAGPSNDAASFVAPFSGVFYAKSTRAGNDAIVNSNYDLSVAVNTGIADNFEPNDACENARDIGTDGVKQHHLFSKPGDQDWVKFTAQGGSAFTVVADGGVGGANPIITIASTCANATSGQPPAEVNVAEATASDAADTAATINGNAATTAVYYVKARNQNGSTWGSGVGYDLRASVSSCTADTLEPDGSAAQARSLAVGTVQAGRAHCPPGDQDWLKFDLTAGKTYVLETRDLAAAADTVLTLYAPDKVTKLGENDDYGYTKGSRLVFVANSTGTHYAKVRHANPTASGATTAYSVAILEGVCVPLGGDATGGDNGQGDAVPLAPNGTPVSQNFCADPLNDGLGDQDWLSFATVAGGKYQIKSTGLGDNSDTVIELYNAFGQLITRSDDVGAGRATILDYTATSAGSVYARVLQFNSNVLGGETEYQVSLSATQPPIPTPTPVPTPVPPPPTPTPNPATAKTLIVVNKARIETLYGATKANNLMTKLFQLADAPGVEGAVIQVENVPAIAAAYTAWTANATSLADTALANKVAETIRAQLMTFIQGSGSQAQNVVLVGDDRIVPFRRTLDLVVPPGTSTSTEDNYAPSVGANTTVRAALAEKMVLTDDYYVDEQPGTWKDKQNNLHELFLPDLAVSRLVEDPNEMIGYINQFLSSRTINAQRILITGYDFVQDGADSIETLFASDPVAGSSIDASLVAPIWQSANLVSRHISASPPFQVTSLNGHSTHTAILVPLAQGNADITATQVDSATGLAGTLIYSVGCHAGLNDPSLLDLPQAYMRRKATYIGNTGFGWGGGGVVLSEALLRNFTREILRDAKMEVGLALTAAKLKYYSHVQVFTAYDAKVLMQMTLYGLPMMEVTSGGTLTGEIDFPSAEPIVSPPTAFGDDLAKGGFSYGLENSFGSFGDGGSSPARGTQYDLDGNVVFEMGAPVQPTYFGSAAAPSAGTLRGVLFLGGTFSDTVGVDPVVALAENEYDATRAEPAYVAPGGWSPAVPFVVRNSDGIAPPPTVFVDSVALSLGQYLSDAPAGTVVAAGGDGTQRLFDSMNLSTFYSFSADQNPPTATVIDGVLNLTTGKASMKVEATDVSGVTRVVVAYTAADGSWKSVDLAFNTTSQKWLGEIPATIGTVYFVQAVDGAGNVLLENNKGNNFALLPPLPLAKGAGGGTRVFLPMVDK